MQTRNEVVMVCGTTVTRQQLAATREAIRRNMAALPGMKVQAGRSN